MQAKNVRRRALNQAVHSNINNLTNLTNFATIKPMNTSPNVYEFKTNFSKYLALAIEGKTVKVMKNNKLVAELVPARVKSDRIPGRLDHLGYTLPDDFDEPDQDLIDALEKPIV
jgi:antitoxin (DNA-binding transcriptional repressor) of toxin-antitoxin stability system